MAKRDYEYKGSIDIYGEKPKPQNPWPFIIIGAFVVLMIIGSCGG